MNDTLAKRLREWHDSGFDPLYVDLVTAVLNRVAQGMNDSAILSYLDYRKRGVPAGSEERAVIDDVARAFVTEGSLLRDDVTTIRQAEERAERERLRRAKKAAKDLPLLPGVSDDVYRLWCLEQRYKNSLIPPGARGGGRSGRRRKKGAWRPRPRPNATHLEEVFVKRNA